MRSRVRTGITFAVALVALASQGAVVGQEPTRESVMDTLLLEVRALRGAIEQMTSASARIQLAVGRLQIQEQRVSGLLRRLNEVRQSLAAAERRLSEEQARLSRFGEAERTSADAGQRQEFASMAQVQEGVLASASSEVQRLRADEADMASLVSAEQGRWISINDQLEDLDRTLQR